MKKFFFSVIPNLTIAVAMCAATILIVDARNPIMGFMSGLPFACVLIALCVLSAVTSLSLFIKYRAEQKQSSATFPVKLGRGERTKPIDRNNTVRAKSYERYSEDSPEERHSYSSGASAPISAGPHRGVPERTSPDFKYTEPKEEESVEAFDDSFLDDLLNEYDFLR